MLKPDIEVAVYYLAVFFKQEPINMLSFFKIFCKMQNYTVPASPLEQMIDKASGYQDKLMNEFAYFVFEYIVLKAIPTEFIIYQKEHIPKLLEPISM